MVGMNEQSIRELASEKRVGRPQRGTTHQRSEQLAAATVSVHHGYGGASINKIAHAAEIFTPAIYNRFKNKKNLRCGVS